MDYLIPRAYADSDSDSSSDSDSESIHSDISEDFDRSMSEGKYAGTSFPVTKAIPYSDISADLYME